MKAQARNGEARCDEPYRMDDSALAVTVIHGGCRPGGPAPFTFGDGRQEDREHLLLGAGTDDLLPPGCLVVDEVQL